MAFEWYLQLTNGDTTIEQGDLIRDCLVAMPPKAIVPGENSCKVEVERYNVIVLTQSCDLVVGQGPDGGIKAKAITVAPYFPLSTILEVDKNHQDIKARGNSSKTLESANRIAQALASGSKLGYHILDRNESIGITEHLVVGLRQTFNLDIDYVREIIKQDNRIRLLPPYREQLSQSFATLFMRVGLPSNIQKVE